MILEMVLLRSQNSEFLNSAPHARLRNFHAIPDELSIGESVVLSSKQLIPTRRVTALRQKITPAKSKDKLTSKPAPLSDHRTIQSPLLTKLLHTGEFSRVVGREKEISFLQKTLQSCITGGKSVSLYVSGAPGTGKTVTVTQEIRAFTEAKRCSSFFLNCMQLTNPRNVYSSLFKLLGEHAARVNAFSSSNDEIVTALESVLEKKSRSLPLVLVLDEVDQLASKFQEVLYTIFGWPERLSGKLVLIGIANDLDLTERLLPNFQSRSLRPLHLAFSPYSKDQICEIISERLFGHVGASISTTNLPHSLAIQFCAKKVAAYSGDVRTALSICRRAIEIARLESRSSSLDPLDDVENLPPLQRRLFSSPALKSRGSFEQEEIIPTIRHVSQAIREAQSGGDMSITQSPFRPPADPQCNQQYDMPLHHKLTLASLLLLRRLRGIRETCVEQVFEVYKHICGLRKLTALDSSEFVSVCELLDSHGLLRLNSTSKSSRSTVFTTPSRTKRVSLLLDDKSVEHSLDDNLLLSSILAVTSIP